MSDTKLKTRESLTSRQRSILISFYNKNPYPSTTERHQLVQMTGRTSKQIQDWFANRRRNDPQFIPVKSTSITQTTPSSTLTTMETNYYYDLPPPSMPPICPCCGLPQLNSPMDQSFYPTYYSPTAYFPFSNNIQL